MFTRVEDIILNATPKKYHWIARNEDGALFLYKSKPVRGFTAFIDTGEEEDAFLTFRVFEGIFKGVLWENSPIRFRETLAESILTDKERAYLKAVLKPFAKNVEYVYKSDDFRFNNTNEFIAAYINGRPDMFLPVFKVGTMYKGMDLNREYTLKELGINYDE